MLSKRIVGSLILKNGVVVQSLGFKRYLPVGSPEIAVEFLNQWGIDEIIVLDIGGNRLRRTPDYGLISRVSRKSFVPLTVGGGIDSIETMHRLIEGGADRVVLNRVAVVTPDIISEAAQIFGNQCVVVSIDVKEVGKGHYEAFIDSGEVATGKNPIDLAVDCASRGAGEILIRSIDRDGSKKGFDINLIRAVSEAVNVPVIAAGGCGHPQHILEAFEKGGANAAAVGNFFHFTEHSVNVTKAFLKPNVNIRLETYANYENFKFGPVGRVNKQPDRNLEKLRFEYHPKEVI